MDEKALVIISSCGVRLSVVVVVVVVVRSSSSMAEEWRSVDVDDVVVESGWWCRVVGEGVKAVAKLFDELPL